VVAEPYYRSLETVRRMSQLVAELPVQRVAVVASKIRSTQDADAVAEFCDRQGFALAATIPWSDAVGAADRARVPVVDAPDTGPVIDAVRQLALSLGVQT